MSIRETIQSIAENWFLCEPVFFDVLYRHQIVANEKMECPIRSGKGRVEFNPLLLKDFHQKTIEKKLGIEMIRILLKHPYERQPDGCRPDEQIAGSDMVIAPSYKIADLIQPSMYNLPEGQNYEWYVKQLMQQRPKEEENKNADGDGDSENESKDQDKGEGQGKNDGDSDGDDQGESQGKGQGDAESDGNSNNKGDGDSNDQDEDEGDGNGQGEDENEDEGNGSDQGNDEGEGNDESEGEGQGMATNNGIANSKGNGYTDLWEEDPMQMCEINEIILASTNWGSVPSQMVEVIYQSTKGRVKYESILREFYASALSDNRRLTRSRPSRRFGFEQMGSFYKYMPKLIVALDCSGSVTSENLGIYLHILSQFFKYGIQGIDVITFDAIVNKEVLKLKKAKDKQITIKGRGGTDFQPVVDYFYKHYEYDGMMIVTDGYAPVPQVPSSLKNKLLWIIDNKQCFESSRHHFSKTGRVCRIEI